MLYDELNASYIHNGKRACPHPGGCYYFYYNYYRSSYYYYIQAGLVVDLECSSGMAIIEPLGDLRAPPQVQSPDTWASIHQLAQSIIRNLPAE